MFLSQLRKTINAAFIHRADKGALECNHRLIFLNATVYPLLISFLCYFPVPFLANLFGADLVSQYIKYVPEWFMHGMTVAGGVLPALGFALTVFVIGNKKLIPFFIIGFFAVQYLGLNTMAAAIFSIAIALLMVFFKQDEAEGEN